MKIYILVLLVSALFTAIRFTAIPEKSPETLSR